MKKENFLYRTKQMGISLRDFGIVMEEINRNPYFEGVYRNGSNWILYSIDERGQMDVLEKGNENYIFKALYDELLARLITIGYINDVINIDVVEEKKKFVCDFLKKKYKISQFDAENTWDYLCFNFHVLNEVKYFAKNNKFVPADDCYKVEGYSAQDIYEMSQGDNFSTHLTEIGAYNYLIYLDKHPEEALKDLKNGLPRK